MLQERELNSHGFDVVDRESLYLRIKVHLCFCASKRCAVT